MKQTLKMLHRDIVHLQRTGRVAAAKRIKKVIDLIKSGALAPFAQSHQELKACGALLVERHTGTKLELTTSGFLYSAHGIVDYVDSVIPGWVQIPNRQPREGTINFQPLGRKHAFLKVEEVRVTGSCRQLPI